MEHVVIKGKCSLEKLMKNNFKGEYNKHKRFLNMFDRSPRTKELLETSGFVGEICYIQTYNLKRVQIINPENAIYHKNIKRNKYVYTFDTYIREDLYEMYKEKFETKQVIFKPRVISDMKTKFIIIAFDLYFE